MNADSILYFRKTVSRCAAVIVLNMSLVLMTLSFCQTAIAQVNPSCSAPAGGILTCSMPAAAGTYVYQIDGTTAASVQLINNSTSGIQVNQVATNQSFPGATGDLCVFLNSFHTRQDQPGIGEVGCSSQASGESNFPPIIWHDPTNPQSTYGWQ